MTFGRCSWADLLLAQCSLFLPRPSTDIPFLSFSPCLLCLATTASHSLALPPPAAMSNSQALHLFLNQPVNNQMLQCLVNSTLKVLPCCVQDSYPSPPSSPTGSPGSPLPSLYTFISKLVKYTNVFTGTLMATLVYLKKLNEKLPQGASAQDPSSRHRIFLACLILSAKFHNDASPKNKHWAKYTDGLFATHEINEMERQLLFLLDWDITVTSHDLVYVLRDFLAPIKQEIKNVVKLKNFLRQQKISSPPRPSEGLSNSTTSTSTSKSFMMSSSKPLPRASQRGAGQLRKFPSLPQLPSQQKQHHPQPLSRLPTMPAIPTHSHSQPNVSFGPRSQQTRLHSVPAASGRMANPQLAASTAYHKPQNFSISSSSSTSSNLSCAPSTSSSCSSVSSVSSETFAMSTSSSCYSSSSSSASSAVNSPDDEFFWRSMPNNTPGNSAKSSRTMRGSHMVVPLNSNSSNYGIPRKFKNPFSNGISVISENIAYV